MPGRNALMICQRCENHYAKKRSPDKLHCNHCYSVITRGVSRVKTN